MLYTAFEMQKAWLAGMGLAAQSSSDWLLSFANPVATTQRVGVVELATTQGMVVATFNARAHMGDVEAGDGVVSAAIRLLDDPDALPGVGTPGDALMAMDMACYLPEDILAKVDRASMAASLEARAPLLDWRVASFAWTLPMAMKARHGQLKWLPKQLLMRYLPKPLVQHPKTGFGAPVGDWLRGPLREWAEAQLDETRLRDEGHFDPAPIRRIWKAFLDGERKWHTHLWGVLMFQAWREGLD